jgi:hypothetical protein
LLVIVLICREYDSKVSENNAHKLETTQKIEKEFADATGELEQKYALGVSLLVYYFIFF